MALVTITVDDVLTALIEERMEAGGCPDVSAYFCGLIQQDMQTHGGALPDSEHDSASEQKDATRPSTA